MKNRHLVALVIGKFDFKIGHPLRSYQHLYSVMIKLFYHIYCSIQQQLLIAKSLNEEQFYINEFKFSMLQFKNIS